jgi:hypothetical protein
MPIRLGFRKPGPADVVDAPVGSVEFEGLAQIQSVVDAEYDNPKERKLASGLCAH